MRKVSSLVCTATAMLLTFGMAMAEDSAQNEQAKPAVTTNSAEGQSTPPENQSKPKEETASTKPTETDTAKPKEDPNCE